MLKNLNRGISAPIAIGIILLVAIVVGGILAWQLWRTQKETTILPERQEELGKSAVVESEDAVPKLNLTSEKLVAVSEKYKGEISDVIFSPNLEKVAYTITLSNQAKDSFVVVVGDKEGEKYNSIFFKPEFTRDGLHVVYGGEREQKKWVIIDGVEYGPYDKAYVEFSANKESFAAIVEENTGSFVLTEEGTAGPKYSSVYDLVFSASGERFAYKAKKGSKEYINLDNKEERQYEDVVIKWAPNIYFSPPVTFSPDDKHFAYITREKEEFFVILDGRKGKGYEDISGPGRLTFSSDSQHLYYVAKKDNKEFVVIDNKKETKGYDKVFELHVDNKGRPNYSYLKEGRACIMIKGSEEQCFDEYKKIREIRTSSDGEHILFVAEGDQQFLLVDGRKKSKGYSKIDWLTYHNGHFIFRADEEKWVLDGEREYYGYGRDRTDFLFVTADGRHIAYEGSFPLVIDEIYYGGGTSRWWEWRGYPTEIYLDRAQSNNIRYSLRVTASGAGPFYSPDEKHFAFIISDERGLGFKFFVKDGELYNKRYDSMSHLIFSSDSNHYAYIGFWAGQNLLVIDGEEVPVDYKIYQPTFSANGDYICYGAKIEDSFWRICKTIDSVKELKEGPEPEKKKLVETDGLPLDSLSEMLPGKYQMDNIIFEKINITPTRYGVCKKVGEELVSTFKVGDRIRIETIGSDWMLHTYYYVSEASGLPEGAVLPGTHCKASMFKVLDGDEEIDSHLVEFYEEGPEVKIFSYNKKTYFLIFGRVYGNAGGYTEHFLYLIDESGEVNSVKNSQGDPLIWGCDKWFGGDCGLKYAIGYDNNLYLIIGDNEVWELDEKGSLRGKFYAEKIIVKGSQLDFK